MSTRQHRTRDAVAEDQLARLLSGEPASPLENTPGPTLPGFPPDARAVIYRPSRSAMTSGRANTCNWVLEFESRSREFIEPLMGWTGGTDPLRHVRLSFPTREAAVAYARREGLPFTVYEPQEPRPAQCPAGHTPGVPTHAALQGDPLFCFAWDRPYLAMPDLDLALLDPARVFASPGEVATHPLLTTDEKREILVRWLWDARRIEAMADEAPLGGGEPSRLDEVLRALALLGPTHTPPKRGAARLAMTQPPAPLPGAAGCGEPGDRGLAATTSALPGLEGCAGSVTGPGLRQAVPRALESGGRTTDSNSARCSAEAWQAAPASGATMSHVASQGGCGDVGRELL
jgi:ETC complex I subunit conserved region